MPEPVSPATDERTWTLIHRPRRRQSMWVYGCDTRTIAKCIAATDGTSRSLPGVRRRILRRESDILRDVGRKAPEAVPAWIGFDGQHLFMARLPGPDLFSLIDELSGNAVLFGEIRRAVRRLHSAGYAHGEIRLGNLIRDDGAVRILDLATATSERHSLFRLALGYDGLTLLWMKRHLFELPFDESDLGLQRRHRWVWPWFERFARRTVPFG